jgi:DNA-binding GntR family transcriptional regulator
VTAKRQTKKDRIVEELRLLIDSGELARGARVHQDELATRFNTSITPVREALRHLEAEGLLVSEPHRGVRVASADLEEVKGVYVARRLLEPYASQRAVSRISRRDLEQAERLTDAMAEAHEAGDHLALRDANRSFHFLFYDRAGISALARIVEDLWSAYPWDILQVLSVRVESSLAEHRTIVASVRDGDLDDVKESVELHVKNSYLALAEHLTGVSQDDPFELDTD